MRGLALFLVLAAPPAAATPDFVKAAVKVYSRSDAGLTEFRGSGTAFRYDGKCYVLTSDHVVLHANKGYRHRAEGAVTATARFLAADWERGLGLLALDSAACGELALDDFKPVPVAKQTLVTVTGFPYDVGDPMVAGPCFVSDPAVPHGLFVALPHLVQINECHGEFGMSGGPVARGLGFVGVLSHQKIADPGSLSNTLLVIPAADAYAWLRRFFDPPVAGDPAKHVFSLLQVPQIQLERRDEVVSQNLWFSIGRFLTLEPSLKEVCATGWSAVHTPAGFPDPNGYFPRARQYLAEHDEASCVYFVGFRAKGFLGKFFSRSNSLVEFFRLFGRADLVPVTWLSGRRPKGWKHPREFVQPLRQAWRLLGCRSKTTPLCDALDRIADKVDAPNHPTGSTWVPTLNQGDIAYLLDDPSFADDWKQAQAAVGPGAVDDTRRLAAELGRSLAAETL